jgi:putative PIN family toxin of toxin-antitoxin system
VSSQEARPKVVFDTMIAFQATVNTTGPAAELFRRLEAGWFDLYVSDEILDEMRDVLSRPKLRAKYPQITDEAVDNFFGRLAQFAQCVSDVPSVFSLPRDPDDEPYLNLSIAVDADYLATRDNDLLDLMQDEVFRTSYPHLTILDPVALLRALTPPIEQES